MSNKRESESEEKVTTSTETSGGWHWVGCAKEGRHSSEKGGLCRSVAASQELMEVSDSMRPKTDSVEGESMYFQFKGFYNIPDR